MKNILVIFTGGTIGSTESNGIINVDQQNNYKLISLFEQKYGKKAQFQTIEIMQVLSENITATHWETLCNYLLSLNFADYNGIIITHGSDTLAFTSALIGLMFAHSEIPIFLVASNKPLDNDDANGLDNFALAVDHIAHNKASGIFTAFDQLYPATKVMPADSCLDRFSSYGNINIDKFLKKSPIHRTPKLPIDKITFNNEILMIYGYPNINFSAFRLTDKTHAVLYVPYHSGTACCDSNNPDQNLTDFITKCKSHGVTVYISDLKRTKSVYVTLDKLLKAGAIPLFDISEVCAYAKLMIAYNQNAVRVDEYLNSEM